MAVRSATPGQTEYRSTFADSVVTKALRARAFYLVDQMPPGEKKQQAHSFVRSQHRRKTEIESFIKRMESVMTDNDDAVSEPTTPDVDTESEQQTGVADVKPRFGAVAPPAHRRNANAHSTPQPTTRVDHEF